MSDNPEPAIPEGIGAEPIVLGSRSPRRQELLSSILGNGRLRIVPPRCSDELSFCGLSTDYEIEQRLLKIVSMKLQDVSDQLTQPHSSSISGTSIPDNSLYNEEAAPLQPQRPPWIVVADTIVIANQKTGQRIVLGQPDPSNWQEVVGDWFRRFLSGTTHSVWTCFCVCRGSLVFTHIVRSEVSFVPLTEEMIQWYLRTGESLGKAGGYGIQGYGAALVCGLQGSLTNVIGLPLFEVRETLKQAGLLSARAGL